VRVAEIQHVLKGSQPDVSHHLKTLADAGLVDSKRDGLWIAYRIADTPEPRYTPPRLRSFAAREDDERVKKDRGHREKVNRIEIGPPEVEGPPFHPGSV